MANRFYQQGLQHLLNGDWNFTGSTIKAALVSGLYSPNTAAGGDEFRSTIVSAGAIVATSPNVSVTSVAGGTVKISNITWSAVTGAQILYIVFYKDTGAAGTDILIAIIDTAGGSGGAGSLPLTPISGDITLQEDTINFFVTET